MDDEEIWIRCSQTAHVPKWAKLTSGKSLHRCGWIYLKAKAGKGAATETRINTPVFVWQPDIVIGLYLLSQIEFKEQRRSFTSFSFTVGQILALLDIWNHLPMKG